jgi:hypothetical protein
MLHTNRYSPDEAAEHTEDTTLHRDPQLEEYVIALGTDSQRSVITDTGRSNDRKREKRATGVHPPVANTSLERKKPTLLPDCQEKRSDETPGEAEMQHYADINEDDYELQDVRED